MILCIYIYIYIYIYICMHNFLFLQNSTHANISTYVGLGGGFLHSFFFLLHQPDSQRWISHSIPSLQPVCFEDRTFSELTAVSFHPVPGLLCSLTRWHCFIVDCDAIKLPISWRLEKDISKGPKGHKSRDPILSRDSSTGFNRVNLGELIVEELLPREMWTPATPFK